MSSEKKSILERTIRASEALVVPKFLIAGEHGAGKTHCMATAPGLFVAVFEGNQSKSTIRTVNPNATIFEVQNVQDFKDLREAIFAGELDGFDVLGVDSFNEMQAYFSKDLEERSKAKKEKSGTTKDNKWEHFRKMKSSMANAFAFLRDIPIAVAATVRTTTTVDDDTGITRVKLNLEGDARASVGAYFTSTAFIYKMETGEAGKSRRAAMFTGPDNFPSREMEALNGICEPNIDMWLRALKGDIDPALYITDARMPGERLSKVKVNDSF